MNDTYWRLPASPLADIEPGRQHELAQVELSYRHHLERIIDTEALAMMQKRQAQVLGVSL